MILNISRVLMLVWFLTGLGHVLAPKLIHHDFDVVGGVWTIVAVVLFSLMTRTARRRKAVATVKDGDPGVCTALCGLISLKSRGLLLQSCTDLLGDFGTT